MWWAVHHGSLAVLPFGAAAQGCLLDKSSSMSPTILSIITIASSLRKEATSKRSSGPALRDASGALGHIAGQHAVAGHIEILDHLRDHGCKFPQDDAGGILCALQPRIRKARSTC